MSETPLSPTERPAPRWRVPMTAGSLKRALLRHQQPLPLAVLLLGLLLTGVIAEHTRRLGQQSHERIEKALLDDVADAIEVKLREDIDIVNGVAGLFNASNAVNRQEFRQYYDTLRREEGSLAGIQGIGFSRFVPADRWQELTAAVRAEGFPDFTIQPAGPRPLASAILFTVVNAAGPWAQRFVETAFRKEPETTLRLVKGSHVVVPKLYDHDYAYIFQNSDRRIVFAIPYEQEFTLIGTTDVDYQGDPAQVAIAGEEVAYLCALASRYFRREVRPGDVVHSYSGVRPLMGTAEEEAAGVTRDYHLVLDDEGAPLLNVIGGKITTYRRLAEDALERFAKTFPQASRAWTAGVPLPGGDVPGGDIEAWRQGLRLRFPQVAPAITDRWARSYGTRFVDEAEVLGLGEEVLPGLYAAEVDYLCRHEWARSAEDILWRRTKLGLHLPRGSEATLQAWLVQRS